MRQILIVEDNEVERGWLSGVLSKEYSVLEAENGEVALSLLLRRSKTISAIILDLLMPVKDGFEVLRRIRENAIWSQIPVIVTTGVNDDEAEEKALALGANVFLRKPCKPSIVRYLVRNSISVREKATIVNALRRDKLTGLYNREAFFEEASRLISRRSAGYYVLASFNIENFKVINDEYGTGTGDEVLKHVSKCVNACVTAQSGICCRTTADKFAVLYPAVNRNSYEIIDAHREAMSPPCIGHSIKIRIGRYIVTDPLLPVNAMYDRAALAEESIKGRYDIYIAEYNESMRAKLLREQQIVSEMYVALREGQFEVWYQPQYNHITGKRFGAEALVRWRHPKQGLISPDSFIPLFEKNGFIYELDKFVWETVCRQLRRWMDEGRQPLPVSVNVSRHDIFQPDFFETITGLISSYELPADMLRLEITEYAFSRSSEQIIGIVERLQDFGFIVEIDDFGSGYSSLNILKDVPADILKLDMRFLESTAKAQRGGRILESVIRMARWLDMPVIAEGVETKTQADYLATLGCEHIQGFLYARPMPFEEYDSLSDECCLEKLSSLETIAFLGEDDFWNPTSIETMVFNHFSGGACVFEYFAGRLEMLRVNAEFAKAFRTELSESEILLREPFSALSAQERRSAVAAVERAKKSGKPETCEFFSTLYSEPGKGEYVHFYVRLIASNNERSLFYAYVENISAQRLAEKKEHEAEEKRSAATEQLQAIMDNISSGVTASISINSAPYILFANRQFYHLFGFNEGAAVTDFFGRVHPEDLDMVVKAVDAAAVDQRPFEMDYRILIPGGETRWIHGSISFIRMPNVSMPVQLAITSDITNQRLAEQVLQETDEQLRFLNLMADTLLAHTDIEAGISGALLKLMEYFDSNRAYVFEFADTVAVNTYEVCAAGIASEKENLQSVPVDLMSPWLSAFDKRGYILIENIDSLDSSREEEKRILQSQGIKSIVAVPLRRDGELIGFLGVDDARRQWAQAELLVTLGSYISVMLTRRDLKQKMVKAAAAMKTLLNDAPGGFCRMRLHRDRPNELVDFNEGFAELVGMTSQQVWEVYNCHPTSGVHSEDYPKLKAASANRVAAGGQFCSNCRLVCGGGDYVQVSLSGRIVRGEHGEAFINAFFSNVTEQA